MCYLAAISLSSLDEGTLDIIAWGLTSLAALISLILTVHHCGLRPLVRFTVLPTVLLAGASLVYYIAPREGRMPTAVDLETASAGVTSETDRVGIQQVMEGIGPEYVSGMLFYEDGQIQPIINAEPFLRPGNSKLYALQFSEWSLGGEVTKVVVYSGTRFSAEIAGVMQSIEVIASGDGDVLVQMDDGTDLAFEFIDPDKPYENPKIRVEEVILSA